METLNIQIWIDGPNCTLVNRQLKKLETPPAIVRGVPTTLALKLCNAKGVPFTTEELTSRTWQLILADDWNTATAPMLKNTRAEVVNAELLLHFDEMETVELVKTLGNAANCTLGAELTGFDRGQTSPAWVVQWEMEVKNRRGSENITPPAPVEGEFVTKAEALSLVSAPDLYQYSDDGINWHAEQVGEELWIRKKSTLPQSTWSEAFKLPRTGIKGDKGDQGVQGPNIDYSPAFSPVISGWEYWLDATFNRLDLLYRTRGMKKIRLVLASANPAITGSIAVTFVINDIESPIVTIPVGATETGFEHVFTPPVNGKFAIVRRIENPLDTLRDGVPVTAVITHIELEYSQWT